MFFLFNKKDRPKSERGFTILELVVSAGIMVIISTIIASSQSQYTSGASLKNVANDIGLSIRQAQIYGISVKEFVAGSENFNIGYGMSFSLLTAPLGDDKAYIFFADRNADGIYNDTWDCPISAESECLDKTSLISGNAVSRLCVIVDEDENCDDISRIDISFVRPAVEARIYYNGGSVGVTGARVELTSPDGKMNSVTVYTTGQVSVK